MKFDGIFKYLGDFGRYQKALYLLLCLPAIPGSMQVIQAVIFLFAVPEHRCAIPGLDNDTFEIQGDEHERLVNLTIPTTFGFYGNSQYSKCELYSLVNSSNDWNTETRNGTIRCDRWVYDRSQFDSTVAQSMDLVCEKKSYISHAKMLPMGGQLVGSLITGALSDMFGRRPLILVNVVGMVVLSISMAWVNSIPLLFFVLYLLIQCTIGQYIACFVFGMEIVAPSKRMWTGITMNFFWSIGNLLVALTAYLLRDWRKRQIIISLPALLLAYVFFLPESPRWLLKHGKVKEAKQILRKIAKGNNRDLDEDVLDTIQLDDAITKREPIWNIFKSPVLIKRVLIICFNWFAVGMGFYGLSMNVSNLSGSIYLNFALFVLVEILAYILCYCVLDRFGRRPVQACFFIATGVFCALPLIPVLVSDQPNMWAINILAIMGNTCASVVFAVVYTYTSELMPTTTRNSCMGLGSMCCRVGSIISPYIVDLTLYVSGRFGQILPMLIIGSITTVAGLVTLLLPETFNKRLPETIAEAEKLGTPAYDEVAETSLISMKRQDERTKHYADDNEQML